MGSCPLSARKQKEAIQQSLKCLREQGSMALIGAAGKALADSAKTKAEELMAALMGDIVGEIMEGAEGLTDIYDTIVDNVNALIGSVSISKWLMYLIDYQMGILQTTLDVETTNLSTMKMYLQNILRSQEKINPNLYESLNKTVTENLIRIDGYLDIVASSDTGIKTKIQNLGYAESKASYLVRLLQMNGSVHIFDQLLPENPDIQWGEKKGQITFKNPYEEKDLQAMYDQLEDNVRDKGNGVLMERLVKPYIWGVMVYEIYTGDTTVFQRMTGEVPQESSMFGNKLRLDKLDLEGIGRYVSRHSGYFSSKIGTEIVKIAGMSANISGGLNSGSPSIIKQFFDTFSMMSTIDTEFHMLNSIYNDPESDMKSLKSKIEEKASEVDGRVEQDIEDIKDVNNLAGAKKLTNMWRRLYWWSETKAVHHSILDIIKNQVSDVQSIENQEEFYEFVRGFVEKETDWGVGEPDMGIEVLKTLLIIAISPFMDITKRVKKLMGMVDNRMAALRDIKSRLSSRKRYKDPDIEAMMQLFKDMNLDELILLLNNGDILLGKIDVANAMTGGLAMVMGLLKECLPDKVNDPVKARQMNKMTRKEKDKMAQAIAEIKKKVTSLLDSIVDPNAVEEVGICQRRIRHIANDLIIIGTPQNTINLS